ncbi:MAG: polysaccharide biosynthesis C-terminal domain-containing protein, partial [Candidatus Paceibacteria bacterium]
SLFVLKGELRVGDTATLKLIKQVVWVGTSIILITIGLGVKGLVFGLLIGLGVMLILGWYKVSTRPSSFSKRHAYSLFQYSKYNFFTNAGGYFYSWVDVAIIGFFLTQTHVGAYEAAWRITVVVILLSKSISTAMFPQMSRWDTNDSSSQIESAIREAIAPSLLVVIPSFFGILLFSSQILRFVFGSEFEIAWLALIVLMGEKIIQSVHMILGRSLQAIDQPNLAARAGVIAIVINLILNLLLIPKFGIVGAALATTISFTCNSTLHAYYLSQFISIELPYIRIAGIVGASIGMSVILRITQSIVGLSNLVHLIIIILLGIISFIVFSLLIPSLRKMLLGHVYRLVSSLL